MKDNITIPKDVLQKICRSVIKEYDATSEDSKIPTSFLKHGFIEKYTCPRAKKIKISANSWICYLKGDEHYRIGEVLK